MGIMLLTAYWMGTRHAESEEHNLATVETENRNLDEMPDGYVDTHSKEFQNNFVDMRKVIDYAATDGELLLYLDDGTGYCWKR